MSGTIPAVAQMLAYCSLVSLVKLCNVRIVYRTTALSLCKIMLLFYEQFQSGVTAGKNVYDTLLLEWIYYLSNINIYLFHTLATMSGLVGQIMDLCLMLLETVNGKINHTLLLLFRCLY